MKVLRSWLAGIGPDRALTLTVVSGAVLAALVLSGNTLRGLSDARREIGADVTARAVLLDARLQTIHVQLESLRTQADQFLLAEHPVDASDRLLAAFLQSNAADTGNRLFHLDRLPAPYAALGPQGNVVALSTAAARRRAGLSRPDPEGWTTDAALGIRLLPGLSALRSTGVGVTRAYYGSVSGLVAFAPWEPSGVTDLLDSYPVAQVFRAATRNGASTAGPIWSFPTGTPGREAGAGSRPVVETRSTVGLPVSRRGAPAGVIAAQIDMSAVLTSTGPKKRPAAQLFLVDAEGRIIAELQGAQAPERPRPAFTPELMPQLSAMPMSHEGRYVTAVALNQAPLLLVHVIDRSAVLLPSAVSDLGSMGLLAAVLGALLLVGMNLMRRILRERETAAAAERAARAAAERTLDDLRAAHDELDFLNREKTRFFSLISHDLRGPFNALLGMTQELADHAPRMRAEDVSDFARSTHQSARQVFELLENLLQWSRVQMSGKPFAPSVFPVQELVADAIRDVQSAAESKDITVLDAVGDRWVLADRTMILAVLRNLLVNALKFSHRGGLVHITSRALGDQLEVAVTDNGVGMEQEQVNNLLRPGTGQKSRPGTQGEVGTGLGLTLVRDLVLRHGGELKVTSQPGAGTVVSFTVPLAAAPADHRGTRASLVAP